MTEFYKGFELRTFNKQDRSFYGTHGWIWYIKATNSGTCSMNSGVTFSNSDAAMANAKQFVDKFMAKED